MSRRQLDTYTVLFVAKTNRALLVHDPACADEEHNEWIPFSQIEELKDDPSGLDGLKKGEEIDVTIPLWLAEEKGMVV